MKVLHVVSSAEPRVSSGYTVRTAEIARHQKKAGLDVAIASADFGHRRRADRGRYVNDGIVHHSSAYPSRPGLNPREAARAVALQATSRLPAAKALKSELLVRWFADQLDRVVSIEEPHVLHAHSPHTCARAAIRVGRRRGIPIVYEVRGLWEESAVLEGRAVRGSEWFLREQSLEGEAMRSASAVVALGEELIEVLERRGIRGVGLAPNCVDVERFAPGPKDPLLEHRLRIEGASVLGYVGSLRSIEGVDFAIRALPGIATAKLLIVGDGPVKEELERLSRELGVADRTVFPGRVPHDRVADYYRLIDVFVVTRPDNEVTRIVTPLKPLEAMASGVPVLASDLPAMRELIGESRGRAYVAGDRESFVAAATELLGSAEARSRIAADARAWVERERTWSSLVRRYGELYEKVLR